MLPVLRNGVSTSTIASAPFNRLDALFDRAFGGDGLATQQGWGGAPMSMWEDEQAVHLEVDVPGVTDENLELNIHKGYLFIRGERKPAEDQKYLFNNRTFGRFERVVSLPEAIATDDVAAELKNGVLYLTLPKRPESKPKKITLKSS